MTDRSATRGRASRPVTVSTTTRSTSADGGAGGGVLLVAGEGVLTTFALTGDEVVIGRAPDCDVVLPHESLSRRHALLRLGARLTVEDLGSKNGLRVGGKRLAAGQRAELALGESFHAGKLSFVVLRAPHGETRSTQFGGDALVVVDPTAGGTLVAEIAQAGINTLILGETGVGKEVLAETLHRLSERKGPLVRVNCAAIAPALIESELFGHEKGAFTGAAQARAGLLEAAQGGSILFDEVGELPAAAQAKLLRAIEAREVTRVGSVRPVPLDVRFIAATNRDLGRDVEAGHFRRDLYFRLNGVTLRIPPLRERRDQIVPLALQFLKETSAARGSGKPPQLAADVPARLTAWDWPGNVRELKAVVTRAHVLARGAEIGVRHLSLTAAPPEADAAATGKRAAAEPKPTAQDAKLTAAEAAERRQITDALERCHGNQTRAARLLGMARSTLVHKLALYRLPRPRK